MGSLQQKMESAFAGVAYAERDMVGEAKRIMDEDDEEPRPRKRAAQQMAGQTRRQGMRAE
jgi:hypothetical protein